MASRCFSKPACASSVRGSLLMPRRRAARPTASSSSSRVKHVGMRSPRFSRAHAMRVASGGSRPSGVRMSARPSTLRGVPSSAMAPSCMTITRSASAASSMKWVMAMTVMPSARIRLTTRERSARPRGSSMADASSRTTTRGFIASALAMASRCFCPPESALVSRVRVESSPTASSAASILSFISAEGTPRFSGPNATSSSMMLATIWSSGFCSTSAAWDRMGTAFSRSAVSRPNVTTAPSCGMRSAFTCLASVDLPDPFAPTMHTSEPCSTLRSICSNAFRIPS